MFVVIVRRTFKSVNLKKTYIQEASDEGFATRSDTNHREIVLRDRFIIIFMALGMFEPAIRGSAYHLTHSG
jgi:hypothetical protein